MPGRRAWCCSMMPISMAPGVDVVAVRRAIGMVFQKPNPFPTMSIFDNVASGLRFTGGGRGETEARVSERWAKRPLGGGQGQAGQAGPRPLGRAAAAPLHSPGARRRPRGVADGRALLGARSGCDPEDRGVDRRAEAARDDRHRHSQHAAGRAGRRHDGLHAERRAGRGRGDRQAVHQPRRRDAPSSTSPGSSADGAAETRLSTRRNWSGSRRAAWVGSTSPVRPSPAHWRRSSTRTSSWRRSSSPTTIASTAATSRCTRR